jgi:hypothetical protein
LEVFEKLLTAETFLKKLDKKKSACDKTCAIKTWQVPRRAGSRGRDTVPAIRAQELARL